MTGCRERSSRNIVRSANTTAENSFAFSKGAILSPDFEISPKSHSDRLLEAFSQDRRGILMNLEHEKA